MTLAFVVLNVTTYALWWKKPVNIGLAVPILLLEHPAKDDNAVVEIDGSVLSSNRIDGVTGLQDT